MKSIQETDKYKFWKKNLEGNGFKINEIDEKFTRYSDDGVALFSTVLLDALTPEGNKIPPICFIKGHVVSVLVCFIDIDTKEKYLLLVRQRRIGDGSFTFEHPAGMINEGENPLEVAEREVKEETGFEIEREKLIKLNNSLLFANPGTSDEAFHFYFCEFELKLSEILCFAEKEIQSPDNFERISTFVKPIAEGHHLITNTNLLLQNFLYLSYVKDVDNFIKLGNISF